MLSRFSFQGAVPLLETDRLRLRGHRADDLASCASMWANPAVVEFIGGVPSTRQQSWSRLLGYAGHWSLLHFGHWVVEEKSSGRFVGEMGFADFKREIEPPIQDVPETGWVLDPAFHGKGYATEALRAVVAWGDEHFAKKRAVCIVNTTNLASIRVAEKCGYRRVLETSYKGYPTILLERGV